MKYVRTCDKFAQHNFKFVAYGVSQFVDSIDYEEFVKL